MKLKKYVSQLDFNQALYPDYFFLKNKTDEELKVLKRSWLRGFLRTNAVLPKVDDKIDFLFFRSMVRDDYKALFHEIASVIDSEKIVFVEDYKIRQNKMNIEASRFLMEHYWIFERINFGNGLLNSCCFIRLMEYLFICSKIISYNFTFLVTFADMQPVENLLVQLTKLTNRKTVTLQHGLYVDYGDMDTVNVVNYKHHCADYFLAWGLSTKRLIEKYHNSIIEVCGKTSIFGLPEHCYPENKSEHKKILVVLDQRIFDEQNFAMLDIVSRYTQGKFIEIYVRFHPSNNKELYFERFPNVKLIVNIEEDFIVIGHTSSMIYEALVLGYESYRYTTEIPSLGFPKELSFTDYASFEDVLHTGIRQKGGKDYIDCTGLASKVKYKNFFNMLLGSTES